MSDGKATRTALVTGATGFVGSHLVRRLVRDGWQVHVVVRPGSDLSQLKDAAAVVTVHRHDGTTGMLVDTLSGVKPELVFHLASLFISEHRADDVNPLIQSNLLFGCQLAEAMVTAGCLKLVNTGTAWQHFQNEDYSPVNLYAATKQAFEDVLRYYVEACSLRVVTLKLFDTYGPGDPRPKLVNLLMRIAKTGETLQMSPGEQLLDLVHVNDVVDAFVLAGEHLRTYLFSSENYVVSSQCPLTLQELVRLFCLATGKDVLIEWGGRPYRQREMMELWTRGDTLPGWMPRVRLEDGFKSLYDEKD